MQNSDENTNTYSTPNSKWEVLGDFKSGQVLEMDILMTIYHWVSFHVMGLYIFTKKALSFQERSARPPPNADRKVTVNAFGQVDESKRGRGATEHFVSCCSKS